MNLFRWLRPARKTAPPDLGNAETQALAMVEEGNALEDAGRLEEAEQRYEAAVRLAPTLPKAYLNLGNVLLSRGEPVTAMQAYRAALRHKPDYAPAHFNAGNAYVSLNQFRDAIFCYEEALRLKPDFADAAVALGYAFDELDMLDDATESLKKAIAIRPDYAEAHNNFGNLLVRQGRYEAAIECYEKALEINPEIDFLFGTLVLTRMRVCDWHRSQRDLAQLIDGIERNRGVTPAFPVVVLTDSPRHQQKAAEIWVRRKYPVDHALQAIPKRQKSKKIRIGYFSADFHNHATSYLMAELFERHDKERFELFAFSFGPDANDEMRHRVSVPFAEFRDVRAMSDRDIASLSRNMQIDIGVDLKGFTEHSRTRIFAFRAAPIQVNYLGYPGTMASEYMDYLIADATLIPSDCRDYYSEKIAYLPDSYQANDSRRVIASRHYTREELGLPDNAFIFCCFNNNYKMTPGMFDCWMRILGQVEDSVLWLLEDNPVAARNLRKEAEHRGVEAKRLVFATRLSLAEHLARHRAADLFLDTLPCNAHTTASDALWVGVPVLTCLGHSFSGRVAASLLNAVGLPELITTTELAYEAAAVNLAMNKDRLQNIRQKLERERLTVPLFDSGRFVRGIEDAYSQMYERYQADLAPDHIFASN